MLRCQIFDKIMKFMLTEHNDVHESRGEEGREGGRERGGREGERGERKGGRERERRGREGGREGRDRGKNEETGGGREGRREKVVDRRRKGVRNGRKVSVGRE